MTAKRFVEAYAGKNIKKLIGIKDIETNRVCITIEENILLLNEVNEENEQLKQFIKSLASSDGRIWLANGYSYRIDKILNGDANDL